MTCALRIFEGTEKGKQWLAWMQHSVEQEMAFVKDTTNRAKKKEQN